MKTRKPAPQKGADGQMCLPLEAVTDQDPATKTAEPKPNAVHCPVMSKQEVESLVSQLLKHAVQIVDSGNAEEMAALEVLLATTSAQLDAWGIKR